MALLWLDLETTGLDSHNDAILEVAWTLTDADLKDIGNTYVRSRLVDCGPDEFKRLQDANEFVLMMHATSGLTDDLMDPVLPHWSLEEIAAEIHHELLHHLLPEEPVYLAGASVHFDLGFIRAQMPELAQRLSHRVYDTSTLKAFFESLSIQHGVENAGQHRALNDVVEVLEVARRFREYVETTKAVSLAATGGIVGNGAEK